MTAPELGDLSPEVASAPDELDRARRRQANRRMAMRRFRRRSGWATLLRVIAAALVLGAIANEVYARHLENQLTEAVQRVTGRDDLSIHCRRIWDEIAEPRAVDGYVWWGDTTAHVGLPVCRHAVRWPDDPTDDDARVGLLVVIHEVAHLVGHVDESETECVAMWAAPDLGVALGGTRAEGRAAAAWYQTERNPLLFPEYHAPGCLASGRPPSSLLD